MTAYKQAPLEPTPEMQAAGFRILRDDDEPSASKRMQAIYRAMLAAAPEPPAESAWRTIESAPAGVEVLVCGTARAGAYVALAKKIDGHWMMFSPEDDGFTVESSGHSHWQPLPAPPALSNKGGMSGQSARSRSSLLASTSLIA